MVQAKLTSIGAALLISFGLATFSSADEAAIELGPWRTHFTWGAQPVRLESEELAHVNIDFPLFEEVENDRADGGKNWRLRTTAPHHSPPPPSGWSAVTFDDSEWPWFEVPLRTGNPRQEPGGMYRSIPQMVLRGRFVADNPAEVGNLRLTVLYVGGVAVYFNGREIARGHLPEGELAPLTVADDYGPEAFLTDDGVPARDRDWQGREEHRLRELTVEIPADQVRPGPNVLALDVRGSALPENDLLRNEALFVDGSPIRNHHQVLKNRHLWSLSGVADVSLKATGGAGFRDASHRGEGVRVWNHPVTERVSVSDSAPPGEPLFPVRMTAPKGGAVSGQVVVAAAEPIRGLAASVSDLAGPDGAAIPAGRVEVRYSIHDGAPPRITRGRQAPAWFDGLEDSPPEETPFFEEHGGAVQPVVFTVSVPSDARPGEYRGTATLTMQGEDQTEVPLRLHVADWALPDRPLSTVFDAVQSPESVAMWYDTPMWSPEHWRLLDRGFQRLGEAGCSSITITLIRRTHFGNEHGMVVWNQQPDGGLVPDLSVAERYIRTAVRHLGRIPIVILYVWEVGATTFHSDGMGATPMDRDILITVRDPDTGLLEEARGPAWGTQECVEFWRPALDGIRDILARHGIADSMMIGVAGDRRPTARAVKTLAAAAPYARWYLHSHNNSPTIHGQETAYWSSVWGSTVEHPDDPSGRNRPAFQRWEEGRPEIRANFPRQRINPQSSPGHYRIMIERVALEQDTRGFGRMGADFWGVLDRRAARFGYDATRVAGAVRFNLSSRYPEAEWRNLGLSYTVPALLAPGEDGPLSSMRLEAIREGIQENEARFFLEQLLADPDSTARLGEDLTARCRELLAERVRACSPDLDMRRTRVIYNSGFQDRRRRLFDLAAEAAARIGNGQ